MHNRASSWKPFDSEPVNYSQKLLRSKEKYFYPTFSSFCAKLSLKKLFSMGSEIVGLLGETFTANYKYSRSNRENLRLPIQIKFSKSASNFCFISLTFLESKWNLKCSEKRGRHTSSVFEFIDSEKCAHLTA